MQWKFYNAPSEPNNKVNISNNLLYGNYYLYYSLYRILQMSIKIVLSLFFLFFSTYQLCVDSLQKEGECTKCGPFDVLIDGRCFIKIRKCNTHERAKNNPDKVICLDCISGFGLNNSNTECVSLSILAGGKDVQINFNDAIVALGENEIKDLLGEASYGNYFKEAHVYFLSKYSKELGKGQVKNVQRVPTKKAEIFVIDYIASSKLLYQAVAYVQKSGNVKEWSFGLKLVNGKQPVGIYNAILKILGDKVKDYFIYDYRFENENFILQLFSPTFEVLRVSLSKKDAENEPDYTSKLTKSNLSLAYLVVENLGRIYPAYKPEEITGVKKFEDFYVVNLGPNNLVSFTYFDNKFIINQPLVLPITDPVESNGKPLLGGYTDFVNYTDVGFTNSIQFAAKQFNELIGAALIKVQSQQVQGVNYNISLKKTQSNSSQADFYVVEVYLSPESYIQLNSLKKNGVYLYHTHYNYNEDPIFFKAYKQVFKSNITAAFQPINSVFFKWTDNKKYYKIFYRQNQYAEVQYSLDTNKPKVLSYTLQGQNLLDTLAPFREMAKTRNPEILMKFVKENQPLFNFSRVQQIIQNQSMYSLNIFTNQGNFNVIIEDKGGLLNLVNYTKLSSVNCYNLSPQEVQNSSRITNIDQFLRANFPLTGFKPQVIQISVRVASINYRILYANQKLKQIQIIIQEADNMANVVKASAMNFAFEIVDPLPTNSDYQAVLAAIKNSNLAGSKIPFLTQSNQTFINSYYDDGKSTTQITIQKLTNKVNYNIISTRSYQLVPDGFNLINLIIPGTPTENDTINLNKINQEATKKYSTIMGHSSVIAFAMKNGNNYTVMFKNPAGYQRMEGKFDDKGVLTLGRLVITGYEANDLANCKKLSSTGRCLSCNQETEVEYQGSCFTKMNGCLIQPGNICVKCNANFIKSAQKCYEQCTYFLQ